MSYSCDISFKHMESLSDLFDLLPLLKTTAIENFTNIAQQTYTFMPIKQDKPTWQTISMADPKLRQKLCLWAQTSIFSYRYFYDKELHLLGIFGLPTAMQHLMDGTVYFQNSCDTDYRRNEYAGIPAFTTIYDKWSSMDADTILKQCDNGEVNLDEDDRARIQNEPEYLAYQLRSWAYNEIWSHCANTLFDDDTATYLSLFGYYDIKHLHNFIRNCIDAYKETMHYIFE